MKSVKTDKADDVTYPCLMVGELGGVVLFTSFEVGTLITKSSGTDVLGEHSEDWNMANFTHYTGTVTLSN